MENKREIRRREEIKNVHPTSLRRNGSKSIASDNIRIKDVHTFKPSPSTENRADSIPSSEARLDTGTTRQRTDSNTQRSIPVKKTQNTSPAKPAPTPSPKKAPAVRSLPCRTACPPLRTWPICRYWVFILKRTTPAAARSKP